MKANLNNGTVQDFIRKVKDEMAPIKFEKLRDKLELVPNKYYKAFLYLIYAGYPARTVLKDYKNLYNFVKRNYVDYSTAVKLITHVSRSVQTGMDVKDLTLFELN